MINFVVRIKLLILKIFKFRKNSITLNSNKKLVESLSYFLLGGI